jgi:hypothetical protein
MRIIVSVVILLLAACTAAPSPQEKLNQQFTGHKADDFFLSYGQPASQTSVKNGGSLYRWVSLEPQETKPTPMAYSYMTPHGKFAVPEPGDDTSLRPQYCELQIHADKKGLIRDIAITGDSPGKWSNSMCADIFHP